MQTMTLPPMKPAELLAILRELSEAEQQARAIRYQAQAFADFSNAVAEALKVN